jgi:hypothetical protein
MSETQAPEKPRRKRSPGPTGPAVHGGSPQARQLGAVILEVLGGNRSPADAAAAVGMSVPRYYQLEARALEGLVSACEPRSVGPRRSPEREVEKLRRENVRLERECARTRALLRMSQRAIGVSAPKPAPAKGQPGEKGKRPRRPTARALKVAEGLARSPTSTDLAPHDTQGATRTSSGPIPVKPSPAMPRPSVGG